MRMAFHYPPVVLCFPLHATRRSSPLSSGQSIPYSLERNDDDYSKYRSDVPIPYKTYSIVLYRAYR